MERKMQILQLFIADIHFKSERHAKRSDVLKLLVVNDEDHSESGIYSVKKLDKMSFRFHQTICVSLSSSQDNLHLHKFHFQVFQVKQDGIRKLAIASAHSSNVDSKISQCIDLIDHHGEVVGILMLSMLFSPSPIDIGEEVHFKTHAPNKSKEYAFLLSRKVRRPSQEKPVAFDAKLEKRVSKDARHYHSIEKANRQRSASAPKARPSTSSPSISRPSSASRPKQRSESPKVRTTAMGVGFVRNAWPEPQDYEADKQLFKIRLAADRKKELLHEIAQQLSAKRKPSGPPSAAPKPRTPSSATSTKRLSSALKAREGEIRELKEQLSRLQVDSRALTPTRRLAASTTSLSSPTQRDSRYSALAERLIDSFEARHGQSRVSVHASSSSTVPDAGLGGEHAARPQSRPRSSRKTAQPSSTPQAPPPRRPASAPRARPAPSSIPFSNLARQTRSGKESVPLSATSAPARVTTVGGTSKKKSKKSSQTQPSPADTPLLPTTSTFPHESARTHSSGKAVDSTPPYLGSDSEDDAINGRRNYPHPSETGFASVSNALLMEETSLEETSMHNASLFPERLLTEASKYDYVIGGKLQPIAPREEVVHHQFEKNRSFHASSASPSPPLGDDRRSTHPHGSISPDLDHLLRIPKRHESKDAEETASSHSDTSVSSEAATVDRHLPLAGLKPSVPAPSTVEALPQQFLSSHSSDSRGRTQRPQKANGKAVDRIQQQFEKNRRYKEAEVSTLTTAAASATAMTPAELSISQKSDISTASTILRNLENPKRKGPQQRWTSNTASDDLSSEEERRVFRKFLDEDDAEGHGGDESESEGEERSRDGNGRASAEQSL